MCIKPKCPSVGNFISAQCLLSYLLQTEHWHVVAAWKVLIEQSPSQGTHLKNIQKLTQNPEVVLRFLHSLWHCSPAQTSSPTIYCENFQTC